MYGLKMEDIGVYKVEGYMHKRDFVITVHNKILAVTGKNHKEEVVEILLDQSDKKLGRKIESRLKEILK